MKTMDLDIVRNIPRILEERARMLAIHLREIANNPPYQRHKGILKARRREIAALHETLDLVDEELKIALGEPAPATPPTGCVTCGAEIRTLYEKLFYAGRMCEGEGDTITYDEILTFMRESPVGRQVIEDYESGKL